MAALNTAFCNLFVTYAPIERNKNDILLRWECVLYQPVDQTVSPVYFVVMG